MITAVGYKFCKQCLYFICYTAVSAEVSRFDFVRATALSFSLAVRGKCFGTGSSSAASCSLFNRIFAEKSLELSTC
jgi:hypothetical protein